MHSRIEDYAMIGDCQTAALVGLNGSIDWLCLPRFDSPSCFSSLLGTDEHGSYCISPSETVNQTRRRYLDGSLILITEFDTDSGSVELTDFMPIQQGGSHVVRLIRGLRGTVKMQLSLSVRFGYGRAVPWADKLGPGALSFVAGPDMLVLRSAVALQGEDQTTSAHFTVRERECFAFVLSYGLSHLEPPKTLDVDGVYRETRSFWTNWSDRCADVGRWTQETKRSLITLKGLSYIPTGGIVAAATTSLPEKIGGSREFFRTEMLADAELLRRIDEAEWDVMRARVHRDLADLLDDYALQGKPS